LLADIAADLKPDSTLATYTFCALGPVFDGVRFAHARETQPMARPRFGSRPMMVRSRWGERGFQAAAQLDRLAAVGDGPIGVDQFHAKHNALFHAHFNARVAHSGRADSYGQVRRN
jgi:hypothetical protein